MVAKGCIIDMSNISNNNNQKKGGICGMSEEKDNLVFLISPKEAQKQLDIAEATLKKYAQLMEEHGYRFHKNKQGHRSYTDSDLTHMRKIMHRKNDPDMTLESAVIELISMVSKDSESNEDTKDSKDIAIQEQHSNDIAELKSMFYEQMEFNKILLQEVQNLKNQSNRFEERAIAALRESMENQKQIAYAQEEQKVKKSFWSKLFKK